MSILSKAKKAVFATVIAAPVLAHANTTLADAGSKIADAIMGFVAVISSVGMAGITVVVLIQGFKMAYSMVKTVK